MVAQHPHPQPAASCEPLGGAWWLPYTHWTLLPTTWYKCAKPEKMKTILEILNLRFMFLSAKAYYK